MNEEERLRLLLVEGQKENRGIRITNGAAKLLGKWPTYVASAIWGVIFIISLITLLSLLIFVLLIKTQSWDRSGYSMRLDNEFCRHVTAANHSLRAMGYGDGRASDRLTVLDSSNNVFFLETTAMSAEAACAVESVLRLCPDKVVFLIGLGPKIEGDVDPLERKLKSEYTNLHGLRAAGPQYLVGTPFAGLWAEGSARALTAAKILTVWQFGGAVVSDNLVMLRRRILDHNGGYCAVDRDLLFCPDQCSAFVYEMLESVFENEGAGDEELVDKSLEKFCGERYVRTGCVGVDRLKPNAVCDSESNRCVFLRIDRFKDKNPDWRDKIRKFCPLVMS